MKKHICYLGAMLLASMTVLGGCTTAVVESEENIPILLKQDKDKPMYPISDGEPITLTYWVPMHNNASKFIQSYNENEAYQKIQEETGIKIEFIHPAIGQEQEQFNLMMASGELPDIIQGGQFYQGGVQKGVEDGAFLDLTSYLEEHAPEYYNLITEDERIKREVFSDNDRVEAFYKINLGETPPWCRPIIREDWLKEFNMEAPVTLGDFEEYLRNIKENKPGVTPFILPKHGAGSNGNLVEIFYGAFNILPAWFVSDDQVRLGNADPKLKDYLTVMNDWYEKGYITKDFPAMDDKQAWAQFDSGKAGMYIDSVNGPTTRVVTDAIPSTPTPYPRESVDSKYHCAIPTWFNGGDTTVVSANSKNKEAAIRFLNYAYTQEGSMLYNYGVEGKTYTMVEGKPKYTDYMLNNPKFSTESANYILRIHFAPKLLTGSPLEFNPSNAKDQKSVEIRMKWCDDPNVDNAYRLPLITLTSDENSKVAKIMTDVTTYSDEMILKFIIGAEPIEKFDNYLQQLEKLGVKEAIEITQTAYNRYMKK